MKVFHLYYPVLSWDEKQKEGQLRIIEKQGFEKEHFLLNPAHFFSGFPTFFLIYSTENDITSSVSDPFFFVRKKSENINTSVM